MGKRESSKSERDTGVSVLGAFKLDHLQPVELILSQNFSIILSFILGLPFLITPESCKWKKMNSPKNWIRQGGFCTWAIQTEPFVACQADFIPKNFQLPHLYTGKPISYYPREGKMRKRDSPKNGGDTGVSVLGAFKLTHLQSVKLLLFQKITVILIFILESPIPYYPREGK